MHRVGVWAKVFVVLGASTSLLLTATAPQVSAAKVKSIVWKWSDGASKSGRSLSKSTFRTPERLPTVDVTIRPKSVPRIASLQWWDDDDGWIEEDRAQSVGGVAVLQLNPICNGGNWCNGSIKYRIVIEPSGNQPTFTPAKFSVKYVNSSSSGGGSSSGGSSSGSSSSGSSSSGGGVPAAAFIGWNLERVQDYLGSDPRTADCSGSGRSVWWASNWWVINAYSGYLVVSKSRYGCS